jgi:hypothetical protein
MIARGGRHAFHSAAQVHRHLFFAIEFDHSSISRTFADLFESRSPASCNGNAMFSRPSSNRRGAPP